MEKFEGSSVEIIPFRGRYLVNFTPWLDGGHSDHQIPGVTVDEVTIDAVSAAVTRERASHVREEENKAAVSAALSAPQTKPTLADAWDVCDDGFRSRRNGRWG